MSYDTEIISSEEFDVLKNWGDLFESKEDADFEIYVENRMIPAHKLVLKAQSPYFKTMLNCNLKESKENYVEIEDYDYDVILAMIEYMYTAKVTRMSRITPDLMRAADQYDLCNLKSVCEKNCIKIINIKNVTHFLCLADKHGADSLKKTSMEYIEKNYAAVSQTDGWKKFETDKEKHTLYVEVAKMWSPTKKRFRPSMSNE